MCSAANVYKLSTQTIVRFEKVEYMQTLCPFQGSGRKIDFNDVQLNPKTIRKT